MIQVIKTACLIGLSVLIFSNCSNSKEASVKYTCLMECEGEKVYTEKGECPVCKMDLIEGK